MRCTVVGPEEVVTRFREFVFREDHHVDPGEIMFDFNQVIPIPRLGRAATARLMKVIEANLPREIEAFLLGEQIRRAEQIWCDTNWGAFRCGHEISFKSEQPQTSR